ncbi:MAG: hypothetical protein ABR936_15145 [Bacteroidota bacterium]|jgi:hypothetical protein
MEEWIKFYTPYFANEAEAQRFVECCENESGATSAKLIMHQTQRLISLSKDVAVLRQGQDGLQLLFLIICAENVAKLAHKYNKRNRSQEYVVKFFAKFLSEVDKNCLIQGVVGFNNEHLSLETIVDALYDVRCEVVHEGKSWGFSFSKNGSQMFSLPHFIVRIQLKELRDIIVRGSICAANKSLIAA